MKPADALSSEADVLPPRSAEELLHDLQVHQIELEMQNEALRDAQVALEESRDRYLDLYEFSPVGYLTLTPAGLISNANLTAATLFHMERLRLVQKRFDRLLMEEDRDRWQQCFMRLKQHGGQAKLDLALQCHDGTQLHVHMDCVLQHIAENPGLAASSPEEVEVRIALTDITQRRQAELALRDSEARYRTLFDATQNALFVVTDAALSMVNAAGLRLLGASDPKQVLGRNPLDFVHPDYRRLAGERTGRSLVQGLPNPPVEMVLVRVDGSLVDGETVSVPVDFQGKAAMQIMVRDISDRKLADRARRETQRERRVNAQRQAEMSRRLVAVQEDLRRRLARELHDRTHPNLAAIGINLEVAHMALLEGRREEMDARMEDTLALIDDTWESIRDICADLRPPALDHAGLRPAMDSYADQYSRRSGIAVQIAREGSDERLAPELESSLFRIYQEALTNTARHAQATAIEVRLQIDDRQICLDIADDGRGFDPAASGETERYGIANMRDLADFSGGSFTLQAKPGAGTRIQVVIPRTEPQP